LRQIGEGESTFTSKMRGAIVREGRWEDREKNKEKMKQRDFRRRENTDEIVNTICVTNTK
jgi:hypothetical protein